MGVTKVTVNLPDDTIEDLRTVARNRNITLTEAIRQAISTQKFVMDERDDGGKLLIQKSDGKIREVVFR